MKVKLAMFSRAGTVLAVVLLLSFNGLGDVKLPSIFSDNMVIQRDKPVPVWGWAGPGEKITVSFADQERSADADANGKWIIKLDPLEAEKKAQEMKVAGKNSISIKNILVGDVWICSGQSNMQWCLGSGILNQAEEIQKADYPEIRQAKIPMTVDYFPHDDVKTAWQICSPQTAGGFTAVGYFFARELYKNLDVPIGLIYTNWGGTKIEPWIAPLGFQTVPELNNISKQVGQWDPATPEGKENIGKNIGLIEEWLVNTKKAMSENKPISGPPAGMFVPNNTLPCVIFNTMINPLIPYAIRGAIWYQGESNGGEGITYYQKMVALIQGWRKLWGQGDFPFYFVQLANFQTSNPDNAAGGDGWANLREAQRKSLEIQNTGMAVTIDIGDAANIHPANKQDVGYRLALWSLATEFQKDLIFSGPLFNELKVEGNKLRISFDHTGSGLMVGKKDGLNLAVQDKDAKLRCFAVAGEDKVWHWADAVIDGNTVVVSSDKVPNPVAVRYAFSMNPVGGANLYNIEGLPASPFRSDSW